MSKKVLFGTLDTIELILFLSSSGGKSVTSSKIREIFPQMARVTLDAKLRKLAKQGFIERVEKERKTAGADRMEYMLVKKGSELKDKLLKRNIQILQPIIEDLIKTESLEKEKVIDKIIIEFSEKAEGSVEEEVLLEQIKLLKEILDNNL